MFPLALLALGAAAVAAYKLTAGPNLAHVAAGLGLPKAYIQYAAKGARANRLPLDWVLTTILVESSGNPRSVGDADGRSVGLMQVNIVANPTGLSREQMFDPATNIEWGTKLLGHFRDQVVMALGGRPALAPLDEITRLAYKGPTTVLAALQRGENPLGLSWAPAAIANWRREMARVRSAEARGRALLTAPQRVA